MNFTKKVKQFSSACLAFVIIVCWSSCKYDSSQLSENKNTQVPQLPLKIKGISIEQFTSKPLLISQLPRVKYSEASPNKLQEGQKKLKSPFPENIEELKSEPIEINPKKITLKGIIKQPILALPEQILAKDMSSKDQNPASFTIFDKYHGLKHSFIACMLEDNIGNIWIGTYGGGITKYDGKSFTHYTEREGLAGNSVFNMKQTSDGKIWIGTYGKGISIFDGNTFENIGIEQGLPSNNIYSILEDNMGQVWIATEGAGVIKFNNLNNRTIEQYSRNEGFVNNVATCIFQDIEGSILVGTEGNGLVKIKNNQVSTYQSNSLLGTATIVDMIQDNTGAIWLCTYGNGLMKMTNNNLISYTIKEGLPSDLITSIKIDANNMKWLGTDGGGIFSFSDSDSESPSISAYTEKDGLSNNNVYSTLIDKNNNIWFGTVREGLNKYSGQKFNHYQDQLGNMSKYIFNILEENNGDIWLSTYGKGLLHLNYMSEEKKYSTYSLITSDNGLSNDNVYCSVLDKDQRKWFGTFNGGINIVDGNEILSLNATNGLVDNDVICFYKDKKSNIWFGNTDGNGVTKYDGSKLTTYKDSLLFTSSVFAICEDKSGRMWFGTDGDGIILLDGEDFYKFDERNGLANNEVFSIVKDSEDNMWVGTSGSGVCVFDGNRFLTINEKSGLTNNFVLSILEDQNKDIWLGTRFGLSILPKEKRKSLFAHLKNGTPNYHQEVFFKNYTYEDGFLGIGCYRGAIYQSKDNHVWIGTTDRLTVSSLALDHVSANDTVPIELRITGVDIYNERIDWQQFSGQSDYNYTLGNDVELSKVSYTELSPWYNLPENLSLRHDNNYVSFNFIGITHDRASQVRYQYYMTGLSDDWSAWSNNSTAYFGNISPGTYTFKVRGQDSNGIQTKEQSFVFTIRPPWWLTWWMKLAYLSILLYISYVINKSQKKRTIKNERLKIQAKELAQAKEIEKAYEELKSTQKQLIQAEKMASLGELTAGIAHEIQNPLNFVKNFSELSVELIGELKEEQAKAAQDREQELENEILTDISHNQIKINYHSKRASSIVKGMLEHSRLSSGKKELTDINQLIDEYVRLSFHGFRAKDSSFNANYLTDFNENIPNVALIPQDIGRVILNLVSNGFYAVNEKYKNMKASDPSTSYKPIVIVSTTKTANTVGIHIKDNGPGIAEEIKEKIFMPFFTTKPTGQGTGLGLSLSYDIVNAHDGKLTVETVIGTENEGTTFSIILPLI